VGQQIGSTTTHGNNTQGRVTVAFRATGPSTDVARTNVQGLELVEVA